MYCYGYDMKTKEQLFMEEDVVGFYLENNVINIISNEDGKVSYQIKK